MKLTDYYSDILDVLLPGWHRVDSDYPTFHTYQHDSCQWWVVIERTGDHAGAVRVTRTDAFGRLTGPAQWIPTHSAEDIQLTLVVSGVPDMSVELEAAA